MRTHNPNSKKLEDYLKTSKGISVLRQIKGIKALPNAFINHLDSQPELLTLQQIADFLGLSKKTIRNFIKYGFLKKNNGYIPKKSLIKFIETLKNDKNGLEN